MHSRSGPKFTRVPTPAGYAGYPKDLRGYLSRKHCGTALETTCVFFLFASNNPGNNLRLNISPWMKQVSATNYVFCLGLSEWLYETRITFRRFLSLFFVLVLGLQLRTLCKTWQTNYKSFAIKDYLSAKNYCLFNSCRG